MSGWFHDKWKDYKHLAEVSSVSEIGRRYFINNAFDGALTMLGVVIGAVISGTKDPAIIIAAGVAGSIAMAVSGFSGSYLTEKAEREREMNRLRRVMLSGMEESIHMRAGRFASIVTSVIDGVSWPLAAALVVAPFILSMMGVISVDAAFSASIVLTLGTLFALGAYLGRVSKTSWMVYGLRMLFVGMLVAVLTILISQFFGHATVL